MLHKTVTFTSEDAHHLLNKPTTLALFYMYHAYLDSCLNVLHFRFWSKTNTNFFCFFLGRFIIHLIKKNQLSNCDIIMYNEQQTKQIEKPKSKTTTTTKHHNTPALVVVLSNQHNCENLEEATKIFRINSSSFAH